MLAQVHLPQVIALLKRRQVIERLTVGSDHAARDVARVGCHAHDAVLDAVEFYLEALVLGLGCRSGFAFLLAVLSFLGFLLFGLLGLLLGLGQQFEVLLIEVVAVQRILVNEGQEDVVLRTP